MQHRQRSTLVPPSVPSLVAWPPTPCSLSNPCPGGEDVAGQKALLWRPSTYSTHSPRSTIRMALRTVSNGPSGRLHRRACQRVAPPRFGTNLAFSLASSNLPWLILVRKHTRTAVTDLNHNLVHPVAQQWFRDGQESFVQQQYHRRITTKAEAPVHSHVIIASMPFISVGP